MGRIVGIDLGVRSVYMAATSELGDVQFHASVLKRSAKSDRRDELQLLAKEVKRFLHADDLVFMEEPIVAGVRNLRTALQLGQSAGMVLTSSPAQVHLVAVAQWKKATVGKGNADKTAVALWLAAHHPEAFMKAAGDQNLIDAMCICLYGRVAL